MCGILYNSVPYYFIKNLQGDVIAIVDKDAQTVARYSYDAWGKILSTTNATGTDISGIPSHIANINPFRYRGYYYDEEIRLYYLQSRYYDAEFSRFISCDKFVCANDDHSAYNLYSYCGNCPADRCDCIGFFWKKIWNGVKKAVRKVLNKTNKILVSIGLDTAAIGAYFLNMYKDSAGIYHAKFDCWQQYFGYNDFYDFMFDIGTSMKNKSFKFYWKGMWYILWAWKGNYINLGAGAEMGIYYDRNGGPCWKVDKKLRQNMTLTLFKGSSRVFSYSADTWWITGFNPNPKYFDVKENQLKASYSVHFKDEDMFKAFKKSNHQGWKYDAKKPIAKYSF